MKLHLLIFFLFTFALAGSLCAQEEEEMSLEVERTESDEPATAENPFNSITLKGIHFTGYADIFGSYQTTKPANGQNPYSSYPFHGNEMGISYAYVQAKYEDSKMMATVALHMGNIVDLMYAEEPTMLKMVREMSVGYRFSRRWWVDAGIFPSVYGTESFITKNNFHATRSITGDFSPDFEEGLRINYQKEYWQIKFLLTNGWQTLQTATNSRRAFGTMLEYHIPGRLKVNWSSYNGMVQQHPPVDLGLDVPLTFRQFDNFFVQYFAGRWSFYVVVDMGWQQNSTKTGWDHWVGNANSVRYRISDKVATAIRYDNYWDPHEKVMFPSMPDDYTRRSGNWPDTTPGGFQVDSYTWTLDYSPVQNLLFRLEARTYQSRTGVAIFPDISGKQVSSTQVLMSMGFSFGR
jgi:hypothetical protein